jgi:hypothetical protein
MLGGLGDDAKELAELVGIILTLVTVGEIVVMINEDALDPVTNPLKIFVNSRSVCCI